MAGRAMKAREGGGKYITRNKEGNLTNTDEAVLRLDGFKNKPDVKIVYDAEADISASIQIDGAMRIRNGYVRYPDDGATATLMMEVIIQYRDTVGITKKFTRDKRSWDGGYGLTYMSVGISGTQYNFLRSATEKALGESSSVQWDDAVNPPFREDEGYYWTNAKCSSKASDRKSGFFLVVKNGEKAQVQDHVTMMSAVARNLLGVGSFTFRLKNSTKKNSKAWTFGLTMNSFQVRTYSDIRGPQLVDTTAPAVLKEYEADDQLMIDLKGISLGNEGEAGDSGEEEESDEESEEEEEEEDEEEEKKKPAGKKGSGKKASK